MNVPQFVDDRRPKRGEVWQESDNVLLLCMQGSPDPYVWTAFFTDSLIDDNDPNIAWPLRILLEADGSLAHERNDVTDGT